MIDMFSRVSREGEYSPAVMNSILGRAGGEAGNVEQQTVADMRGNLEAGGMGRSIAGTRTLAMPGIQRMRTLADMGGRLTEKNEISKVNARRSLAEIEGNYGQAVDDSRTARRNQLVDGFADAASAGFSGYMEQENLGEMADFGKMHSGIQSYITGGGDLDGEEFAAMFEKAYGIKWPGKKRSLLLGPGAASGGNDVYSGSGGAQYYPDGRPR